MNLAKEMYKYYLSSRGEQFGGKEIMFIEDAARIAKQYAEEMCKKQREICANADFYQPDYVAQCYCEVDCDVIRNAPLATEEKQNGR